MTVAGIIAEYNPFHNGHRYHLRRTRAVSGCDFVVVVMSGAFAQRGGVTIADKWTRARAALMNGADAVFELPALYALRAAPDFARGGVSLLHALGVVSHLSFGSELPLRALKADESAADSVRVKALLKQGVSYPKAVSEGIGAQALTHPNATLGIEYLRAIRETDTRITPIVIERTIAREIIRNGDTDTASEHFAAASRIRRMIRGGLDISAYIPPGSLLSLNETPSMAALEGILLNKLRENPASLAGILGAGEGLEIRAAHMARKAHSYNELLQLVKCKRYTMARIRRFLVALLLDITTELAVEGASPRYARLLGFRRDAAPLLGAIKRSGAVPIIAKAADYDRNDPIFKLDVRAQDMQGLAFHGEKRRAGLDYVTSPVVIP